MATTTPDAMDQIGSTGTVAIERQEITPRSLWRQRVVQSVAREMLDRLLCSHHHDA